MAYMLLKPKAMPERPLPAKSPLSLATEGGVNPDTSSNMSGEEKDRLIAYLERAHNDAPKKKVACLVSIDTEKYPYGTDIEPKAIASLSPNATDDSEQYFRWLASHTPIPNNYTLLVDRQKVARNTSNSSKLRLVRGTKHSSPSWDYIPDNPVPGWKVTTRPPSVYELCVHAKKIWQYSFYLREASMEIYRTRRLQLRNTLYQRNPRGDLEKVRLDNWFWEKGIIPLMPSKLEITVTEPKAPANNDPYFELRPKAYLDWLEKHANPRNYFFGTEEKPPVSAFERKCLSFTMHLSRFNWGREDAVSITQMLFDRLFKPYRDKSFIRLGKPYGDWSREEKVNLIKQFNKECSNEYMHYLSSKICPQDTAERAIKDHFAEVAHSEDRIKNLIREVVYEVMDSYTVDIVGSFESALTDGIQKVVEGAITTIRESAVSVTPKDNATVEGYVKCRSGVYLPEKEWVKKLS